jgi:hypothetical protein
MDCGGAGNRTPCLSHAKRALYHMSYTPVLMSLTELHSIYSKISANTYNYFVCLYCIVLSAKYTSTPSTISLLDEVK